MHDVRHVLDREVAMLWAAAHPDASERSVATTDVGTNPPRGRMLLGGTHRDPTSTLPVSVPQAIGMAGRAVS